MNNQETNITKRVQEVSTDKYYISRIVGKLKTLLLNSSASVQKLKEVYKSLTYQNLKSWSWPYKDYYFSGTNPILPKDWFEKWNLDMFKNIDLLEDILARNETINFEWNSQIKNQIHTLVQSLIQNQPFTGESPIIDLKSQENFSNAITQAEATNRKIVFIANHASHFDTPILSYTLEKAFQQLHQQHPDIPIKKIRFICGAYMYYNKGVRNFTTAFDTTLVFGPKDLQEMKLYLETYNRKDLILKLYKQAIQKTQQNNKTETTLLFPYAGRSENKNGCKEELPKGISQYFSSECIYVPIWCIGSDDIFPTGDLYQISKNIDIFEHIKNIIKYLKFSQLIKLLSPKADQKQLIKLIKKAEPIDIVIWILENMDIFKLLQFLEKYKFKFFKPGYIYMTVWESFAWWEKTLEEINETMHTVSNQAISRSN